MGLNTEEINAIADDLDNLETALADRGMNPSRVTAILAHAAPAIVTNITGMPAVPAALRTFS